MFLNIKRFQFKSLKMSIYALVFMYCLTSVRSYNYCSLCRNHTMCSQQETGPECAPLMSSGVTMAQEDEIVNAHNKFRRKVAKGEERDGPAGGQPKAANMMEMKWDSELAAIAQRWANQCTFGHDECRDVERFYVGQNVFMTSSSIANTVPCWKSAVQTWYDEVTYFHPTSIDPFDFTEDTGHYSQLVWAESSAVGCGLSNYQANSTGLWFNTFYVCNYGPAGNVLDESMYKQGTACMKCPNGTTCADGLCASSDKFQ